MIANCCCEDLDKNFENPTEESLLISGNNLNNKFQVSLSPGEKFQLQFFLLTEENGGREKKPFFTPEAYFGGEIGFPRKAESSNCCLGIFRLSSTPCGMGWPIAFNQSPAK
ncbi:hypothetical protein TNCT_607021 [Trichonephila clavata]|uniref:Uncharacterized protein n=1 Tax=Trichonephila clavata TaxID=2740835 RepID=A0A8X6G3Q7_TRICU|nr:hypothetical protein TNCT_607021 [Trichonephila clavata]